MSWIKVILALIVVSIILLSIIEFATSVFFLMKADTQISAVTFVDKSLNKLGNILNPSHQAEKFDWTALQHKNKHSLEEYRTAAWVRDFQSPNIKYYPFSLWRSETNFVSKNVKTNSSWCVNGCISTAIFSIFVHEYLLIYNESQ